MWTLLYKQLPHFTLPYLLILLPAFCPSPLHTTTTISSFTSYCHSPTSPTTISSFTSYYHSPTSPTGTLRSSASYSTPILCSGGPSLVPELSTSHNCRPFPSATGMHTHTPTHTLELTHTQLLSIIIIRWYAHTHTLELTHT